MVLPKMNWPRCLANLGVWTKLFSLQQKHWPWYAFMFFFHSYFILGFVIECASAIENLYSLCHLLVKVYTDALREMGREREREVSVYD